MCPVMDKSQSQLGFAHHWERSTARRHYRVPRKQQDPNAGNSRVVQRERKCADTIGTVLISWAGHFQC